MSCFPLRHRIAFCAFLLLIPLFAHSQVIESAAGPTAASIIAARDAFRTDLGGGTVAGANGSFGGVRREINWDGVPDALAAPNNLPANRAHGFGFLLNSAARCKILRRIQERRLNAPLLIGPRERV